MPDEPVLTEKQLGLPADVSSLVLKCVICSGDVPKKRASGRSKDTCGPYCQKMLRKFRKFIVESSRCPACYHPSTPAERRDFIAWRKARGDRRNKPGRPRKPQEDPIIGLGRKMVEQLNEFIAHDRNLPIPSLEGMCSVAEQLITDFQKVIDTKAINQSTLPPSGQTAQ